MKVSILRRPFMTLTVCAAVIAGCVLMASPSRATAAVTPTLALGDQHSCLLFGSGSVKCWGRNAEGELGLGDTNSRGDNAGEMGASLPFVSLGTGRTAVAITAGALHTCVILNNGSVKCWGYNAHGELGLGDTSGRGDNAGEMGDALPTVSLGTGRTAVAISAKGYHTCALLDNASVKCWGNNSYGQLGQGDTNNRGDNAGPMGDALPAINLGTGRTAVSITSGFYHTCARLDNATVKCWGNNDTGQLGLGDTAHRGDNPGEMGDALPTVSLGTGRTATSLTVGNGDTCARLDNSTLKCWGYNTYGELGLGDTSARGDNAGEMGDSLPAVSLGTGRTALSVNGAYYHTCARLDNSTLKCWGYNAEGELGLGDTAYRGDNAGEMGDSLPIVNLGTGRTAVSLASGGYHNCVILDNNSVKCWGYNFFGQLGLGDASNRGDNAGEMGDALPVVSLAAPTAANVSVSGRVTDASGTGIRGARVVITDSRGNSFSALTNSFGYYVLEVQSGDTYIANATAKGSVFETRVMSVNDSLTDVDFTSKAPSTPMPLSRGKMARGN